MSTISPYVKFKNWLTRAQDNELDEAVTKAISPLTVLAMFGSLSSFTVYLNDNFNNFKSLKHDPLSFYNMLKQFSINKKISQYDFSFINIKKEKELYKQIKKVHPHLKPYEVEYLVNNCKDDHIEEFAKDIKIKSKKKSKKK